jgi:hypothetical protein
VVLEQRPAQSLEIRVGLLFEPTRLVQGKRRIGDDAKLVERDASVGQVKAYALVEGGRHVDADRGELLRFGMMLAQVSGELLDSSGVPAFSDEHYFASFGVSRKRPIVVPRACRTPQLRRQKASAGQA